MHGSYLWAIGVALVGIGWLAFWLSLEHKRQRHMEERLYRLEGDTRRFASDLLVLKQKAEKKRA